jgi:alpha-amylase
MKKQTGVDGFRRDAVKHFSYNAQQDLSYNLKYNASAWPTTPA